MSRNEDVDYRALAFEFVSGTLRGVEREGVKLELQHNNQLQLEVAFWEEYLTPLQPEEQLSVPPTTWNEIIGKVKTLEQTHGTHGENHNTSLLDRIKFWLVPSFASMAIILFLFVFSLEKQHIEVIPDYIAVLTNHEGEAVLTALTHSGNKKLTFKWEDSGFPSDGSLQLWAKSKRDGQIRPVAVFDENKIENLSLSIANWRLITDSASLILTEEESGGSAIDEPSDIIIAKGICVRFSKTNAAI